LIDIIFYFCFVMLSYTLRAITHNAILMSLIWIFKNICFYKREYHQMPYIINDKSVQIEQVPYAKMELKPHQCAIVKKCIDIESIFMEQFVERIKPSAYQESAQNVPPQGEQNVPPQGEENAFADSSKENSLLQQLNQYGVIGTSVGSGKTFIIIALCLLDKFKKKNYSHLTRIPELSMGTMIVVPSHLFFYWEQSIKKFAGNVLSVTSFDDYQSVMKLYTEEKLELVQSSDIYLVSSLFYETVASSLATQKIGFKRVIFDEIDSIHTVLHTLVMGVCNWFVSGSIKQELIRNPVFSLGETLGKTTIQSKDLLSYFIDCDEEFIQSSFNIPPYEFSTITCDNPVVDALKNVFIPKYPKALYALNSCDPQTTLIELGQEAVSRIPNDNVLADIITKNWAIQIKNFDEYIQNAEKMKTSINKEKSIARINQDMEKKVVIRKDIQEKDDYLRQELAKIQIIHDRRPKLVTLSNMIVKNKNKKILLYAEFPRVFSDIVSILEKYNIKYVDFEGGNSSEMNKSIEKFKSDPETTLFLAYSTLFSCGTNMENLDMIIFLHRVRPEIQKQVIGRGQRPGRTSELKVFELLHRNEKRAK